MDNAGRNSMAFRVIAVLLGATSIVMLSIGDRLPVIFIWSIAVAGLICAASVLYISYGKRTLMGKSDHVNLEFRREVERYLGEVAGSSPRGKKNRYTEESCPSAGDGGAATPQQVKPATAGRSVPTGDSLGKLSENMEVLAGYREDLVALLQLHRKLADPGTGPVDREKTMRDIARFEKTIALPFLLEDSEAVQQEVTTLVGDLRSWLRHGAVDHRADEVWSPVDLHSRVEMALDKLPGDRGRSSWFQRHYGEIALVLTKPQSIFEAFHSIFDYFTDMVGSGQAIHIRTAQRGEYAWIGIGAAPNEHTAGTINLDPRIEKASRIWSDLGANMVTGDNEVRILLPLHGPMHLFHEEVIEKVDKKTG